MIYHRHAKAILTILLLTMLVVVLPRHSHASGEGDDAASIQNPASHRDVIILHDEPTSTPTLEPTRTPRPTPTPPVIPPPSDPANIRILIGLGVLIVVIVLAGVWINRRTLT